jgi:hypothetical protein
MIRKAHIIGILALGLAATMARTSPVVGRVVSSALSLPHYIRDSRMPGESLGPIERFVFSLVLTSETKAPQTCEEGAVLRHRT